MDIAIVAPCPVPYQIGGAENLWRGLQDFLNQHTPHQAEVIKLPSREHSFWELVNSYRRFAELDLEGFDLVVSGKYPAWMVEHSNHVCYMLHRLRGLYDTYHFFGLPEHYPTPPAAVRELCGFMEAYSGQRGALAEAFERLEAIRDDAAMPPELFAFPGPFIRAVVHYLDGIGLAPGAVRRYGAISATVRDRDGYFPTGADVFVAYPPTAVRRLEPRRGSYLFTVSRLDNAKRVELLVRAMQHVTRDVELRIAGGGPEEAALRALADGDRRVVFCGRVPEAELVRLYAGARAVGFVPYNEDYGYITLEAMLAGKPVITCTDSGGASELVEHGETGLVVEPRPEAVAEAIDRLWSSRRLVRHMGRRARAHGQRVTWRRVVEQLVATS